MKRLDHGELNIPGRTSRINSELDKHKAEVRRKEKFERRSLRAEDIARKEKIKTIIENASFIDAKAIKLGTTPRTIISTIKDMPPRRQDQFIMSYDAEMRG